MELSIDELKKIYDKVIERICQNGWGECYTSICIPVNTEYNSDNISFTAIYERDNGEYTIKWEVEWYINSDGSIDNSEGEYWKSLEVFDC